MFSIINPLLELTEIAPNADLSIAPSILAVSWQRVEDEEIGEIDYFHLLRESYTNAIYRPRRAETDS